MMEFFSIYVIVWSIMHTLHWSCHVTRSMYIYTCLVIWRSEYLLFVKLELLSSYTCILLTLVDFCVIKYLFLRKLSTHLYVYLNLLTFYRDRLYCPKNSGSSEILQLSLFQGLVHFAKVFSFGCL